MSSGLTLSQAAPSGLPDARHLDRLLNDGTFNGSFGTVGKVSGRPLSASQTCLSWSGMPAVPQIVLMAPLLQFWSSLSSSSTLPGRLFGSVLSSWVTQEASSGLLQRFSGRSWTPGTFSQI